MGRSKVKNVMTTPEWLAKVNPYNMELMEEYLENCSSTKADSTIKEYRCDLKIAFCWGLNHLDNKPFTEWKKRDFQKYQNHLVNTCHLSPARVRRMESVVSSLSNFIERMYDDEHPNFRNVAKIIEKPPIHSVVDKTVYSEEEIDDLLQKLTERKEYRKACLVALAAFSGRRKSELLRFKVSDFSDDKLICDGALYESSPLKTKGRGKLGKVINCYTLAKNFKPYLDNWLNYRKEIGLESEWLFPNQLDPSKPFSKSVVDDWYDGLTKLSGKPFYLHSLRHNFTTRLLRAGIPAQVVKDIIGWSNIALVDCYSDLTKAESFNKYFGAEGIKKVVNKSLNEI